MMFKQISETHKQRFVIIKNTVTICIMHVKHISIYKEIMLGTVN